MIFWLKWLYNERDGVSNHQLHPWLVNSLHNGQWRGGCSHLMLSSCFCSSLDSSLNPLSTLALRILVRFILEFFGVLCVWNSITDWHNNFPITFLLIYVTYDGPTKHMLYTARQKPGRKRDYNLITVIVLGKPTRHIMGEQCAWYHHVRTECRLLLMSISTIPFNLKNDCKTINTQHLYLQS